MRRPRPIERTNPTYQWNADTTTRCKQQSLANAGFRGDARSFGHAATLKATDCERRRCGKVWSSPFNMAQLEKMTKASS